MEKTQLDMDFQRFVDQEQRRVADDFTKLLQFMKASQIPIYVFPPRSTDA